MFEEPYRHYVRHQTNTKRNKLRYLLENHINTRLLCQLETDLSITLLPKTKAHLVQRIKDEYAKRLLPEETYENWYPQLGEATDSASKVTRKAADNFDVLLRQSLLQELRSVQAEETTVTSNQERPPFAEPSEQESIAQESVPEDLFAEGQDQEQANLRLIEPDLDSSSDSDESQVSEAEDSDSDSLSDSANVDAMYAHRKAKKWQSSFDPVRSWSRHQFNARKWGLEPLDFNDDATKHSVRKQHMRSLNALLHINMLRQNWNLAYKLFCLLLRMKPVDVRLLWPIGVEILLQKRQQLEAQGKASKLDKLKARSFLEWLSQIYPVFRFNTMSELSNMGPVFRSGSLTHAPMFVITLLWQLLVDQQYSKLRETLDELLMTPPYESEGVCYLIYAYCNLAESIHLASRYANFDKTLGIVSDSEDVGDLADDVMLMGSKETIKAKILENIVRVRVLLDSCDQFKFEYPADIIDSEIETLRGILSGLDFGPLIESLSVTKKTPTPEFGLENGLIVPVEQGPRAIPLHFLSRFITGKSKNARQSWVWGWCTLSEDGNGVCDLCGKVLQRKSGSTIILTRHLRTHGITQKSLSNKKLGYLKEEVASLLSTQKQPSDLHSVFGNRTPRFSGWSKVARRRESAKENASVSNPVPVELSDITAEISDSSTTTAHKSSKQTIDKAIETSMDKDLEDEPEEDNVEDQTNASNEQSIDLQDFGASHTEGREVLENIVYSVHQEDIEPDESDGPQSPIDQTKANSHKITIPKEQASDEQKMSTTDSAAQSTDQLSDSEPQDQDQNKGKHTEFKEQFSMLQESLESEDEHSDHEYFAPSQHGRFLRQRKTFSPDTTMESRYEDSEVSRNFHEFATQTQESQKRANFTWSDHSDDSADESTQKRKRDMLEDLYLTSLDLNETSRDSFSVLSHKDAIKTKKALEEAAPSSEEDNFVDAQEDLENFPNPLEEEHPALSQESEGSSSDQFDSAVDSFNYPPRKKTRTEEMDFDFDFE